MKYPALLAGIFLLIVAYSNAQPPDTAEVYRLVRLSHSFLQTNTDSSGYYARRARELAERLHSRLAVAVAGITLCDYYISKGDLELALPYCNEAVSIYDSLRRPSDEADAYLSLAQLYKELSGGNGTEKFIDRSIQYSRMATGLYASVPDRDGMVTSLNMEGVVARDKAMLPGESAYFDSALTYYESAIRLNEKTGAGHKYLGKLYNNISQIYSEYKHEPRVALAWLQKAVAINEASGSRYGLTFNYNNLAEVYTTLGRVDSALFYARKMLMVSEELKLPSRIFDAYDELYLVFEAGKRYDSALHYYILASGVNQQITNLAKTKDVLDLQAKYNDVKKELNIQRLHAESAAKNKQIVLLSVLSGCLVILVSGFSFLIYRLRMQKRQIAGQSRKLETMLRELHHRVKNNLQTVSALLGLQTYKLDDEKTIGVLQESRQRVQAMSLIHQRLYNNDVLSAVNIREYLIDLTESLLSSYGYDRDSFDLRVEVGAELLDIEQALPIGLIVNELVTNAFKYAYPGVGTPALLIRLQQGNSGIVLEVKDNGVGIDAGQWRMGKESFGKQLVRALCRQLRATQQLRTEEGTEFRFVIPRRA